MNIQERIEALETEFADKIKALKAEAQQVDEFPQYGDDYWFSLSGGTINDNFYTNSHVDNKRLEIGNVFQTKEQAEFAVEKLKVEAELRKFSRPFKFGDWNFEIIWNNHENNTELDWSGYIVRQGVIYFESGEIAEKAIEAVGKERIKKYVFEVED